MQAPSPPGGKRGAKRPASSAAKAGLSTTTGALRSSLLSWFHPRRATYPWRGIDDLWKALVAEVMLHQTQESRATPAWQRFVARYPTPASYARARDDAVRSAWAGLGYYGRAFRLRRAARLLAADGTPRASASALGSLPGVGPYTAAILASTLWREPIAAIDGNVTRVVMRLVGARGDPGSAPVGALVRRAADALLDPRDPGAWNEALMDLGRTVCTPRTPDCGACPLSAACAARRDGLQTKIPASARKRRRRTDHVAVALVGSAAGLLVVRRPTTGLLARQWALPTAVASSPAAAKRALDDDVRRQAGRLRGRARRWGADTHTFTHRRWDVTVWRYEVDPDHPSRAGSRWVWPGPVLDRLALPSLYRRVVQARPGPALARRRRPMP